VARLRVTPPAGWHCVGRVEDLAEAGAWLVAPLTPAGVLVVRGDDGALRAFHAVCTHRGSALFDEGAPAEGVLGGGGGSGAAGAPCAARAFTCPYHGLAFGPDGAPCSGPEVVLTTDPGPLRPARVDTALGFVFVTLDADDDAATPPLAEALGEAPPWLERAGLGAPGRLRRARRVSYDVAARLSIVLENFQESLHFATVHPALEALTPSSLAETWMPSETPSGRGPWLGGLMPIVPTAETVSVSGQRMGRPWLVPEEDRGVVRDAMRFPNLLVSLQPDYLLTFVAYAVAEDRTRVVASIYLAADAPDDAHALSDLTEFWDRVYDEDRAACERQERGMKSGGRVRYSAVEEGAAAVADMARDAHQAHRAREARSAPRLCGIFGAPFADLSDLVDTSSFPELHREITRGLSLVEPSYTGGTLKWMGVCAPWIMNDGYRDAMHAIAEMSRDERAELVALGDGDADGVDLDKEPLAFGDETDRPFNLAQMRFLEQRHGVYFPWKVCYHLLENDRWEDKHSGEGKDFAEEARELFPKTVAFIESLPFTEIGRVVVFGLLANDHAPLHRDSEPGQALAVAQSISFEPGALAGARKKRFYLATPDGAEETVVDAPVYWFNDMDWHGVKADPYFRYSIRVDGVFEPAFLDELRRHVTRRRRG